MEAGPDSSRNLYNKICKLHMAAGIYPYHFLDDYINE